MFFKKSPSVKMCDHKNTKNTATVDIKQEGTGSARNTLSYKENPAGREGSLPLIVKGVMEASKLSRRRDLKGGS